MGIQRRKKEQAGLRITAKKLRTLLVQFLAEHEADMRADYKPESEQWRQCLSDAMTEYVIKNIV